jgi:hypothetical protein
MTGSRCTLDSHFVALRASSRVTNAVTADCRAAALQEKRPGLLKAQGPGLKEDPRVSLEGFA